jgi:uncharacterized Zn finger protein
VPWGAAVVRRWGDDDWPPPSQPIPVEGGIRARSKRGSIGEQWWSRRFIGVLESLGMSGRLQRGRRYARTGQVLDLQISTGQVSALVQGSRPAPYKVRIKVVPLTTAQWRQVEQALAGQALFRARLLAGEMPAEIEDVFADCRTPLFPRSARDLDMRCSCPDWEVPCKHLAAVCYVLAEQFDDDPFAMLAWRGRGRDALLAALRRQGASAAGSASAGAGHASSADASTASASSASASSASAGSGSAADSVGAGPGDGPGRTVLDVPAPPLADCLEDFWLAGLSPARLRALPAAPATTLDLLLRLHEPPAVRVRGKDLADLLGPAYQLLAAGDELVSGE